MCHSSIGIAIILSLATCAAKADDGATLRALVASHGLTFMADDIDRALSDEEIRPVVERVRGYLSFHGFKIGPKDPHVLIAELHDGNQSEVAHGLVLLGARQPEACRGRLIAHEATHFFLGRDHGRLPNDPEVEALANAMERLVVPEYLPNCGDRG